MGERKFGVGQSVRRVEDARLVTGTGRYTDDALPPGTLHAVMVRSPHAHADFTVGDLAEVRAMPGVRLVLAPADVADLGTLPCPGAVGNADGSKMRLPPYPILAQGRARHLGDAVAFVVADTVEAARDAAEAFPVTYAPKPAVIGFAGAERGSPVWEDLGTNLAFDSAIGDAGETDAAFARAARTLRLTLVNNRLVTNYLETRSCLAEYAEGNWTLTLGSQGVHAIRDTIATAVLRVDPARIRVVTPDVGGGFGTKIFTFREYPLCALAAERLGRPVKWTSERTEHFVADAQGRDNLTTLEVALDPDGRFLALRSDIKADMGAYLSQFAPYVPVVGAGMTPGVYDIPAVHVRIRGYYTNTVPVDAYRGAGRPEAAYAIERFVDYVAREIGMAPDALRARNFVQPEAMPHTTRTGKVYDTGEFEAHMRRALALGDAEGFPARLAASQARGCLRGVGLSTYIEACAGGRAEDASVRLDADGGATVTIGTQSTGQGHLTAYAQLVSQHLDLPVDQVRVLQGDTAAKATGGGTGGSRSIPVGGASVAGASRTLARNLRELAAEALEAGIDDLEIVEGGVRVVGTDRSVGFADLARTADPALLEATDAWTPPEATYPNGTHVCEVEIDPDTGITQIARYTIVDDFGVTLNPLLLQGQVHGGVAQGIGQALQERTLFDAEGQLLTASFMDYQLPRAADIPDFRFETRNVPSTSNVMGMKGAGEAGAIGACPAVINAVVDALDRAHGIRHVDMPATPDRVYLAIEEAKAARATLEPA